MAYWENGRCYFHGSSQSQSANNAGLARMLNIDLADLVFINEATGGGFGSKIGPYPYMAITGQFSRQLNRPVQLRHHPGAGVLHRLGPFRHARLDQGRRAGERQGVRGRSWSSSTTAA